MAGFLKSCLQNNKVLLDLHASYKNSLKTYKQNVGPRLLRSTNLSQLATQ